MPPSAFNGTISNCTYGVSTNYANPFQISSSNLSDIGPCFLPFSLLKLANLLKAEACANSNWIC